MFIDIAASILLGLSAGILSNLFGVGGGVLFITFLPYLGFSEISSIATSLAIVCLIALMNSIRFQRLNLIRWKCVFKIIPFALLFSFSTTFISHGIEPFNLKILFAVVISLFFVFCLRPIDIKFMPDKLKSPFVGFLSGSIAGFTGLGAGGIMSFLLLSWKIIKSKNVVPTINAIMVFTTLAASVSHFSVVKNFRPDIIIVVFLSAQISGAHLANRQKKLSDKIRRRGLIFIFGIIALKSWIEL